jgi:hypothetical protein
LNPNIPFHVRGKAQALADAATVSAITVLPVALAGLAGKRGICPAGDRSKTLLSSENNYSFLTKS